MNKTRGNCLYRHHKNNTPNVNTGNFYKSYQPQSKPQQRLFLDSLCEKQECIAIPEAKVLSYRHYFHKLQKAMTTHLCFCL